MLRGALGDKWALVKGYRNRRGEIDYLLLGPGGLFAIEVKYVNGTFAITRERWRYVRYDNYGNQVGAGLLQDARRRPPNVQLAEPLAALEQFLASRGQPARMRPVVLLNHPKARVSHLDADVGVEVLTSTAALRDLVRAAEEEVSDRKRADIERLVVRDHHFHEERRLTAKPDKPARPGSPRARVAEKTLVQNEGWSRLPRLTGSPGLGYWVVIRKGRAVRSSHASYRVQRGPRGLPEHPAGLHRGRGRAGLPGVVRRGHRAPRVLLQAG